MNSSRFLRLIILISLGLSANAAFAAEPQIAFSSTSGRHGDFAAREIRRYIYLRCGSLPAIQANVSAAPLAGVILTRKNEAWLPASLKAAAHTLGEEDYVIQTIGTGDARTDWIVGGSDTGVLYGAYRFAEKLGVRFYLHGDVVPDEPLEWKTRPAISETGKPLFATRGILPFHDFPEGPDWWTSDDYALYFGQLPKMRMNFVGLHCYPESRVGPEPLVLIGQPSDLDATGNPTFSYPAFWFNSANDRWGFVPGKSSEFSSGAGLLFESDYVGPSVMEGRLPIPQSLADTNRLFAKTGELLSGALARAREVGVKIAVGTETPLTIPAAVAERLESQGKNPKDPATVQSLYEGMFKRIAQLYPVDYYWLWTPEIWTWSGNDPTQFTATVSDIQAAQRALDALGNPFTLATAGWVLGPLGDRTALDRLLPKNSPMSCISRECGHALVEAGFAGLQGRPKWSMPWPENDPNLTAPQLWVGRMRYDTVDSLKLGCTGILLNHWRTKIMAPNLAAIAESTWDQSYAPKDWDIRSRQAAHQIANDKKILGGTEFYSERPVAGTDESFIYQRAREDFSGYDLFVPDGRYAVTLRFNEPTATHAGERVFSIQLGDKLVEPKLDIFARVGAHHALDLTYTDIAVTGNELAVRLKALVGKTCLSALTIQGVTTSGESFSRKMRCGRIEPVLEYEGDRQGDRPTPIARERSMPIGDFYADFARANFGREVAEAAGKLFVQLDGTQLPELGTWIRGPGGINARAIASPAFAVMHQLAALRPQVRGAGNLERFDYWVNTFRAFETGAQVAALRAQLDRTVAEGLNAANPTITKARGEAALQIRISMARTWEKMMSELIATVSTPGELGTIVNFEQHNRLRLEFLSAHDKRIESLTRTPLPSAITPESTYRGAPRLILPTVRNTASATEALSIKIIVLDAGQPHAPQLHWRKLGEQKFHSQAAKLVSRNTFIAEIPAGSEDLEYYFSGTTTSGQPLIWPATSPTQLQTVVHTF